jgi:hypothetical protein
MTTDGLLDVLQGDWRRLMIETASAAAVASIAALCGVLASSFRCCEFWYYRRTRRAFAWGAAVGIGIWLVTLFGAQFLDLKSPQPTASWHDNRGLWILRLTLAVGAAGCVAFQAHQRMLWPGERASPAPLKASFRLRHLLVMQGLVAIVVCGWLVNVRVRGAKASWEAHLRQREQLAKELFEPYGFQVQLNKADYLFLHTSSDMGQPVTDSALTQMAEYGRIRVLWVRSDDVTHEGLSGLARVPDLRELRIISNRMASAEAAALAMLPSLQSLQIHCPSFDDEAAAELNRSRSLAFLELRDAPITDEGLLNLAATAKLRGLVLDNSLATAQGVQAFQEIRPDVRLSIRTAWLTVQRPLLQPPPPRQRPDID